MKATKTGYLCERKKYLLLYTTRQETKTNKKNHVAQPNRSFKEMSVITVYAVNNSFNVLHFMFVTYLFALYLFLPLTRKIEIFVYS